MFCSVDTFIGMRCTTANHLTYLMVVYSAMEVILQKKIYQERARLSLRNGAIKALRKRQTFL